MDANGKDFVLSFPVDCELGKSCYIQQYVDHDPSKGFLDYRCQVLSYDGHNGTDVALVTQKEMRAGVNVVAAAEGYVYALRDGMEDKVFKIADLENIVGKECGNGILIKHQNDWMTQYCHLKKNSIKAEKGQKISAGEVIGQVGLSGLTEFPHLHFSVRKDGRVIDPFHTEKQKRCWSTDKSSLWQHTPPYRPGGLLVIGFSDTVPAYEDITRGMENTSYMSEKSDALILYVLAFGLKENDILSFKINGPTATNFTHQNIITKSQAQTMRAAGLRRLTKSWPSGAYIGTVDLIRDHKVREQLSTKIFVK